MPESGLFAVTSIISNGESAVIANGVVCYFLSIM